MSFSPPPLTISSCFVSASRSVVGRTTVYRWYSKKDFSVMTGTPSPFWRLAEENKVNILVLTGGLMRFTSPAISFSWASLYVTPEKLFTVA